jgi:hypothetical protein
MSAAISRAKHGATRVESANDHCHEAGCITSFYSQQDGMLGLLVRILDGLAHICRGVDRLEAHIQNHVPGAQAAFGCAAAGINFGDHNAPIAHSRQGACRGEY